MTFWSVVTLLACCLVAAGVIWMYMGILMMVRRGAQCDREMAEYWAEHDREMAEIGSLVDAIEAETDTESGG